MDGPSTPSPPDRLRRHARDAAGLASGQAATLGRAGTETAMRWTTKLGVTLAASVVIVGVAAVGWAGGASSSTGAQPQDVHPQVVNPHAFIDTSTEAKYTAIDPCRIVDTRAAGGPLAVGATRNFQVTGSTGFTGQGGHATGCNVPAAATAVAATVVAVDETGPGFLVGWPTGSQQPGSSFMNYAGTSLVSSGATLSINQTLSMTAGVSRTDVVIDIDGYYLTPMWAQVNSSGTLIQGSRVTGTSHLSTGEYEVDFDRDVSRCAYNATPYSGVVTTLVEPRSGNADGVFVEFINLASNATDAVFYLTVTC
jgi:hypothetical protein